MEGGFHESHDEYDGDTEVECRRGNSRRFSRWARRMRLAHLWEMRGYGPCYQHSASQGQEEEMAEGFTLNVLMV